MACSVWISDVDHQKVESIPFHCLFQLVDDVFRSYLHFEYIDFISTIVISDGVRLAMLRVVAEIKERKFLFTRKQCRPHSVVVSDGKDAFQVSFFVRMQGGARKRFFVPRPIVTFGTGYEAARDHRGMIRHRVRIVNRSPGIVGEGTFSSQPIKAGEFFRTEFGNGVGPKSVHTDQNDGMFRARAIPCHFFLITREKHHDP